MERKFKKLIISSVNFTAKKALILSHGGYTPSQSKFRKGSGLVAIPHGLTMEFNSMRNEPSIGTKANHLLNGFDIPPQDTVVFGAFINNYSLTHNPLFDRYKPNEQYDLIRIDTVGKSHMTDVFEAIKTLDLGYTDIRSFACRINKLTYDF